MKFRVLIPLALMALLLVPTASAEDSLSLSNPLETLYTWVSSVWDSLLGDEAEKAEIEEASQDPKERSEPETPSSNVDGDQDPDSLPGLGPWIEPHG